MSESALKKVQADALRIETELAIYKAAKTLKEAGSEYVKCAMLTIAYIELS